MGSCGVGGREGGGDGDGGGGGPEYIVSLWSVTLRRGALVFVIVLGKEALGFLSLCVSG